jgi:hypothetical protein
MVKNNIETHYISCTLMNTVVDVIHWITKRFIVFVLDKFKIHLNIV